MSTYGFYFYALGFSGIFPSNPDEVTIKKSIYALTNNISYLVTYCLAKKFQRILNQNDLIRIFLCLIKNTHHRYINVSYQEK